MTVVQSCFPDDGSWLLGDKTVPTFHSEAARKLHEVRLAAAIFKRRFPLLLHWRRQTSAKDRSGAWKWQSAPQTKAAETIAIATDLPHPIAIQSTEVALLRAFLSREIDNILFGND